VPKKEIWLITVAFFFFFLEKRVGICHNILTVVLQQKDNHLLTKDLAYKGLLGTNQLSFPKPSLKVEQQQGCFFLNQILHLN
jgi:hypothetical protein